MSTFAYIKPIADALLTGFGTNLFEKSTQLIEGIAPLFMIGFTIYVMLVFWDSYRHGVEENFLHLCKKFLGWTIVIVLAFNATEYQKLANILYTLPDQASSLFGYDPHSIDASAMDTCMHTITGMVGKIFDYGHSLPAYQLSDKITISMLGNLMSALGFCFFLVIFGMYLIAKLSLAMVILVGPIFIGAMLFPATRQWGMNWLGQVLNYTISVVFYVVLSLIQMTFFHSHLENLLGKGVKSVGMIIPVELAYFGATIIFVIVALSVPHIASALFGGASISAHAHSLSKLANLFKGGGGGGKGGGGSIKKD